MAQQTGEHVHESAPTGPRFIQGPSACGTEFDDVEWSGIVPVHLRDDIHLGIRFNDAGVQAHVAAALGDRVSDVDGASAYFSVRLGTPGRRKAAPLHHLYLGARPVLGTRDLTRLLGGLAHHLGAHVEAAEGHVVRAIPVRTPRGVMLVPAEILPMAGTVDRLLPTEQFSFADVPHATIDLAAGTVSVATPVVDLAVSGEQAAALGPTASESRLDPGTYPLAGWLLSVGADQLGQLRQAPAVAHAARLLDTPFPQGAPAALEGLVALAGSIPMIGVSWATPDELVGQVRAVGLGEA